MDTITTIEYRGYGIEIWQDIDGESPREWSNAARFYCFHPEYNLGDKHDFADPDGLQDWIAEKEKAGEILYLAPIRAYEHGGITLRLPDADIPGGFPEQFRCQFDSGMVGWAIVLVADYEECKGHKVSKANRKEAEAWARRMAKSELETYDAWGQGWTYGFSIIDADGESLEIQAGFICEDGEYERVLEEARGIVDGWVVHTKGLELPMEYPAV